FLRGFAEALDHSAASKPHVRNRDPLTQPLPPILRLRRGAQDQRNHTHQHPNSNQDQEESSALFHGPTIMRPQESGSKLPHSKRCRESRSPWLSCVSCISWFSPLRFLRFLLFKPGS